MQQGVIRFALAASLLALLAACTTAPVSTPATPAEPVPRAGKTPKAPGASSSQTASPAERPADEPARPELLAGEPAREFERGGASWYGPGFQGRRTASGEIYDMHALTAAHRTLPFGTMVRVHSLVNGRDVDVRITDRGPFSRNRIIDVSRAAAEELGMLGLGFKEVVLLVPESTPAVAEARPPPAPAKKRARVVKRVKPKAR
ncbi:septal ring lytic transglycosylase RlpA family protein [Polaromonas sp. UC242_47]|uniref:septal ring lytic transglycosylase RlpA family protein n=1 Tax=Polaromonas sp. UC242_47 TaxID=3374626 RepID=UPI0037A67195